MEIESIKELWKTDAKINIDDLATESIKIPQLHSKYYNFFVDEKIKLRAQEGEYKILKRLKLEYYTGRLSPEQINKMGWDSFQIKILKQDADIYLDSDTHLVAHLIKMGVQQEKVDFLESIIKTLNNRGFHLKTAVDFIKFSGGV